MLSLSETIHGKKLPWQQTINFYLKNIYQLEIFEAEVTYKFDPCHETTHTRVFFNNVTSLFY